MAIRPTEHKRHARKGKTERSAVAQHALLKEYEIHQQKTRVFDKSNKYWQQRVRETVYISGCGDRTNKNGRLQLGSLLLDWL